MSSPKQLFALLVAYCGLAGAVFAGDPSGTWKWMQKDPASGSPTPREMVLTLTLVDGKLAGTITMPGRGVALITKDIIDAAFKDDVVSFVVERDVSASKVVTKYRGKVTGDFINGTVEGSGREGLVSLAWTASRAK